MFFNFFHLHFISVFTCTGRSLKPTQLLRVIIAKRLSLSDVPTDWLTDRLTDWMNECDQSKQTSDTWLRQKQREDTIPVFRPAADIRHACGAINKQWVRSRPPSPLFQLNCHRCVAPLPTTTTKQTSSTPSASINKDTVFVRLCEGVWLVAIMALAPACVIAMTCGFSFFFFSF